MMIIRKFFSPIAIFIVCILLSGMALAKESDVTVRAGLAKKNEQGEYVVYKETTTIPFVPKSIDPTYYFGVTASTSSGKQMVCRVVFRIPKQNALHGNYKTAVAETTSDNLYTIVGSKDLTTSWCNAVLRLDDDDIPGKYIIEIYSAGELLKRVQFDVQRR